MWSTTVSNFNINNNDDDINNNDGGFVEWLISESVLPSSAWADESVGLLRPTTPAATQQQQQPLSSHHHNNSSSFPSAEDYDKVDDLLAQLESSHACSEHSHRSCWCVLLASGCNDDDDESEEVDHQQQLLHKRFRYSARCEHAKAKLGAIRFKCAQLALFNMSAEARCRLALQIRECLEELQSNSLFLRTLHVQSLFAQLQDFLLNNLSFYQ
jgi:hypothetical protein